VARRRAPGGIPIRTLVDARSVAQWFHDKGVAKVVISSARGGGGGTARPLEPFGMARAPPPPPRPPSTSVGQQVLEGGGLLLLGAGPPPPPTGLIGKPPGWSHSPEPHHWPGAMEFPEDPTYADRLVLLGSVRPPTTDGHGGGGTRAHDIAGTVGFGWIATPPPELSCLRGG